MNGAKAPVSRKRSVRIANDQAAVPGLRKVLVGGRERTRGRQDSQVPRLHSSGGGGDGSAEGSGGSRPRTRAECLTSPRPCPWVGCRYHLFWELAPRHFSIPPSQIDSLSPDKCASFIESMPTSCVLDIVQDGMTLEETGKLFGITRERVRQIQAKAMRRLKYKTVVLGEGKELLEWLEKKVKKDGVEKP